MRDASSLPAALSCLRRALLPLAALALSTCVDASGELELTITTTDLCSGMPGATELTDVGIIIGKHPASVNSLPEFTATFDGCADLDDGVLFEETFEFEKDGLLDVLVVGGVRLQGADRSAAGCREDLVNGAFGTTPCVLSKRRVGVAYTSVTQATLELDSGCMSGLCGAELCLDDLCNE